MLISLRDGHEPLHVETQHIASIEGMMGGRECLVRTVDGTTFRVQHSPAEVIRRMQPTPPDWLGTPSQQPAKRKAGT